MMCKNTAFFVLFIRKRAIFAASGKQKSAKNDYICKENLRKHY